MDNKNPWSLARVIDIAHEDESETLEFKSLEFKEPGKSIDKQLEKLLKEEVYPAVSAFLNGRGGTLILGIGESRDDKGQVVDHHPASHVRRTLLDRDKLHARISGNIEPTPAALIVAYAIRFTNDEDPVMGFAVEVREGHTAYQCAPDRIYYQRDGTRVEPMPDKNIRLRMLVDRLPVVSLDASLAIDAEIEKHWLRWQESVEQHRRDRAKIVEGFVGTEEELNAKLIEENCLLPTFLRHPCTVRLGFKVKNVGSVTIREFALQGVLSDSHETLEDILGPDVAKALTNSLGKPQLRHVGVQRTDAEELTGMTHSLFPDQVYEVPYQSIVFSPEQAEAFSRVQVNELHLDTQVFLDNAPSLRARIDLGPGIRTVVSHYLGRYRGAIGS